MTVQLAIHLLHLAKHTPRVAGPWVKVIDDELIEEGFGKDNWRRVDLTAVAVDGNYPDKSPPEAAWVNPDPNPVWMERLTGSATPEDGPSSFWWSAGPHAEDMARIEPHQETVESAKNMADGILLAAGWLLIDDEKVASAVVKWLGEQS